MIKRFTKLKTAVRKSLLDLKESDTFADSEISHLEELSNVLYPIKSAVEVIGCRNASLLTADVTLKILFNTMDKMDTLLSRTMLQALTKRVTERRTSLYSVLHYLHNGNGTNACGNAVFGGVSRKDIQATVEMINRRLYIDDIDVGEESVVDSDSEFVLDEPEDGDIKDQYFQAIQRTLNQKPHQQKCSIITKEMIIFEKGGQRGKYLEQAYKSLLTIPPSSIEAERSFSAAGIICSKLRSQLGDSTLSTILLLRAHFKQ